MGKRGGGGGGRIEDKEEGEGEDGRRRGRGRGRGDIWGGGSNEIYQRVHRRTMLLMPQALELT